MSTATADRLMTAEEFLALPDDGVDRWLIRGKLYENRGNDVTKRNRRHSTTTMRIGQLLLNWSDGRPEPRGEVAGGEAGFILRRNPDSTVGIDVAYVSPETVSHQVGSTTYYDGPPLLAVEILSPSNTHQEVTDKVRDYLAAGVKAVWVVDPDDRTVKVAKPGQPPVLFNDTQAIAGDPELPGFSARVADFFR